MCDPAKRPDLSAKMERLKRGLIADTVKIASSRYPSLKESQLRYSLKSGRFGAFDPLRRRSKLFRASVAKYAPPYYFWHKEYISTMKRKPVVPADETKEEPTKADASGNVRCIWCDEDVPFIAYTQHKVTRCKRRYEFLGRGYYRCPSCKDGFLDDVLAIKHTKLHFPLEGVADESGQQKVAHHPIVCRDQAKRKKWL